MMSFENFWDDFGFHFGPFRFTPGAFIGGNVRYNRTDDSHLLRIRIHPDIKKEQIKVRLVQPGVIELEWPRQKRGEEITVE
jgi:hypothetical protein